ncbi:hypothetical protein [Streptomyces albicerus]|uniref:hypothetical protein n=1 Tax=Streptomyces albicerus TaxID=2569859 RepID=UPI001788E142|nr:hypothetical protein [Streptomyces albicerus]
MPLLLALAAEASHTSVGWAAVGLPQLGALAAEAAGLDVPEAAVREERIVRRGEGVQRKAQRFQLPGGPVIPRTGSSSAPFGPVMDQAVSEARQRFGRRVRRLALIEFLPAEKL